jgi:hypothetical protein
MSSALHRELLSQAHATCVRLREGRVFFSILWRMADRQYPEMYLRQGGDRRWWRYEERFGKG